MKKTLTVIIIICFLGGLVIINTGTSRAASAILYSLKEFVIYPLVRMLANSLENKIVNNVNNLVSGVTTGNPSFITNWRNYVLDSQARGNDVFRSVLADTNLCPFFKDSLLTSFGAEKSIGVIANSLVKDSSGKVLYQNKTYAPGTASFQQIARCTLPVNFNIQEFNTDFAKGGGWDSWNKLLETQNNPIGVYLLSMQEKSAQESLEQKSAENSSIAGQGFLSKKLGVASGSNTSQVDCASKNKQCTQVCTTQPVGQFYTTCVNSCSGQLKTCEEGNKLSQLKSTNSDGCVGTGTGSRCTFLGKEVTPAKVLGEAGVNAVDKKIGRVGAASQLTDVVLSLVGSLVRGLTNNLTNYLGQATYDAINGSSNAFEEGTYEPGAATPQPTTSTDPTDKFSNSNLKTQCLGSCNTKHQDCLDSAQTCTSPVPDPTTGITPAKTCTVNLAAQQICEDNRNSCRLACDQLPN